MKKREYNIGDKELGIRNKKLCIRGMRYQIKDYGHGMSDKQ